MVATSHLFAWEAPTGVTIPGLPPLLGRWRTARPIEWVCRRCGSAQPAHPVVTHWREGVWFVYHPTCRTCGNCQPYVSWAGAAFVMRWGTWGDGWEPAPEEG
jgi:hypothetical protein